MTDLQQFTEEVRSFLSEKLTPELQRAGMLEAGIYADRPVAETWLKILNEQGWAVERGATGWPSGNKNSGWRQRRHYRRTA